MFRGAYRRNFKGNTDAESAANRRMALRLSLRADRRANQLEKRRKRGDESGTQGSAHLYDDISSMDPATQDRLRNLHVMAENLRNGTNEEREKTVEQIRKLLSIEKTPPIQTVINAGLVTDLMQLLRDPNMGPKIRFEAAWALTNVASGSSSHTKVVVDEGGIEVFVGILATETGDIKEQAVWALGNIAGDSAEMRDRVLRADALNHLLSVFVNHNNNTGLLRNATWTLSNFCRGKPHADFEILRPSLQLLNNLLQVEDEEILVDTCWAISYISDDPTPNNARIQEVIGNGFLPHLIRLLDHGSTLVVHPALRAVGNIVTGSDEQTQEALDEGVLPALKRLLQNEKVGIRKEACWTISNITAGNVTQIEDVIRAQLIQPVLVHLQSAVFEIRKEACWAISNATAGGNDNQIKFLVQCGCIKPLINTVEFSNPKTIRVALEGLENILKSGQDSVGSGERNPYVQYVEECDGFNIIAQHQDALNGGILEKVQRILMYSPQFQNSTQYAI